MQDTDYWNNFYSSNSFTQLPSQFAAFVALEANPGSRIVDLGCGNGRDSFFFASHGFSVTALDNSEAAVDRCRSQLRRYSHLDLKFRVGDATIRSNWSLEQPSHVSEQLVIYSRFLYHALGEDESAQLLMSIAEVSRECDLLAAFEFRISEDEPLEKLFGGHHRRFESPDTFRSKVLQVGLEFGYQVTGKGFAKYGKDDAYVMRALLRSTQGNRGN